MQTSGHSGFVEPSIEQGPKGSKIAREATFAHGSGDNTERTRGPFRTEAANPGAWPSCIDRVLNGGVDHFKSTSCSMGAKEKLGTCGKLCKRPAMPAAEGYSTPDHTSLIVGRTPPVRDWITTESMIQCSGYERHGEATRSNIC
eukprot:s2079_g6.t1